MCFVDHDVRLFVVVLISEKQRRRQPPLLNVRFESLARLPVNQLDSCGKLGSVQAVTLRDTFTQDLDV